MTKVNPYMGLRKSQKTTIYVFNYEIIFEASNDKSRGKVGVIKKKRINSTKHQKA
jgi:hypothetical protein